MQDAMRDFVPANPRTPLEATGKTAGEYVLGRKLGEGGCGTVYEAVHPLLMRRAAVKVPHRVPAQGSANLLRFVAEAKAVNQIRSRHIVDVFSFGALDDGDHFMSWTCSKANRWTPSDAKLTRLRIRPLLLAHGVGIALTR